jgi:4a-hydroxytetrahydrobiopterin dehydratase
MTLVQEKCRPCQGGEATLPVAEAEELAQQIPEWSLAGKAIERQIRFGDFREAMAFVNKVAVLAEGEGHHPDIYISWNKVRLTLTTHAIGGLSRNDFVLAAKIDKLLS